MKYLTLYNDGNRSMLTFVSSPVYKLPEYESKNIMWVLQVFSLCFKEHHIKSEFRLEKRGHNPLIRVQLEPVRSHQIRPSH